MSVDHSADRGSRNPIPAESVSAYCVAFLAGRKDAPYHNAFIALL